MKGLLKRLLARLGRAPEAVPQELPPASLTDRQERRRSRAAAHRLVTAGAHP